MTVVRRREVKWTEDDNGCHVCTSHRPNGHGYPELSKDGRTQNMHRVLYEETHGPLGNLVARHTCDNRRCINLGHVVPGTQYENAQDRNTRGRNNPPVGERSGTCKLRTADVLEIRASTDTHEHLAHRYGVGAPQISRIKSGKRWSHV
mgnify:CR=1 FL=1